MKYLYLYLIYRSLTPHTHTHTHTRTHTRTCTHTRTLPLSLSLTSLPRPPPLLPRPPFFPSSLSLSASHVQSPIFSNQRLLQTTADEHWSLARPLLTPSIVRHRTPTHGRRSHELESCDQWWSSSWRRKEMGPTGFRQALLTALGGNGSWMWWWCRTLVLWTPVGLCAVLVPGRTLLAYFYCC